MELIWTPLWTVVFLSSLLNLSSLPQKYSNTVATWVTILCKYTHVTLTSVIVGALKSPDQPPEVVSLTAASLMLRSGKAASYSETQATEQSGGEEEAGWWERVLFPLKWPIYLTVDPHINSASSCFERIFLRQDVGVGDIHPRPEGKGKFETTCWGSWHQGHQRSTCCEETVCWLKCHKMKGRFYRCNEAAARQNTSHFLAETE